MLQASKHLQVESLLRVEKWEEALRAHPDCEYVAYHTQGICQGIRIGFNHELIWLKSAGKNMQSATNEPAVIDAYTSNDDVSAMLMEQNWQNWISRVLTASFSYTQRITPPGNDVEGQFTWIPLCHLGCLQHQRCSLHWLMRSNGYCGETEVVSQFITSTTSFLWGQQGPEPVAREYS